MTLEEAREIFDKCYIKGEQPPQDVMDVLKQYPVRPPEFAERNPDQTRHNKRLRSRVQPRDDIGRFSL